MPACWIIEQICDKYDLAPVLRGFLTPTRPWADVEEALEDFDVHATARQQIREIYGYTVEG